MNLKITALSVLLASSAVAAYAQDALTQTFNCVASTWIRESKGDEKRGTADSIELGYDGDQTRAGLLGFEFAVPEGMKVQTATLHIYSKLARTGQDVYVYAYPNDFTEGDACWNVEVNYHNQALEQGEITTFRMGGQAGASIYDGGIRAENQSLEKWTNDVDITNYVKSLSPTTTRINLMLKHNEMSRFYPQGLTGDELLFKDTESAYNYPKADLAPVLIVTFVEDAATSTDKILPVADTQIRKDNAADNSKATAIEIKSTSNGERLYGLMRFELPSEVLDTEKYELTAASLRLVCTQNKGDRNMSIYDFGTDFAENATYAAVESYVDEALGSDPVAEFSANGLGNLAMGDNKAGNWANYMTADAWTNNIDLTDYINGKIGENASKFNILITKTKEHNDAMKFATKEAVDITNAGVESNGGVPFTFAAADLVPQLTLVYSKKEVEEPGNESVIEPADSQTMCDVDKAAGKITISTAHKDYATLKITAPEGTTDVYYLDTPASKEAKKLAAPDGYSVATSNGDGTYSIKLATGSQGTLKLQYVSEGAEPTEESYDYDVTYDVSTAVEAIETVSEANAVYYTLQGVKVANPEQGNIYIKVVGGKATKIKK